MNTELLTVQEVAFALRVSRSVAQSWIDSKELPAIDVSPTGSQRQRWRILKADFESFVAKRMFGQHKTSPAQLIGEEIPDLLLPPRKKK